MSSAFLLRLKDSINRSSSPICVGLDPDPKLIPPFLGTGVEAMREFVFRIIEATRDLVPAFKPNTAFFEAYGWEGWKVLEELRDVIGPDVLLIADAKRSDIDHTNEAYARAIFDRIRADAVTVQPYLGFDALKPFIRNPEHGMFVCCATSNKDATSVQEIETADKIFLYNKIAELAAKFKKNPDVKGCVGLVVGTTKPEAVDSVLNIAGELPILLPGNGRQAGKTVEVVKIVEKHSATALFNFSRTILYASMLDDKRDFADAARKKLKEEIERHDKMKPKVQLHAIAL
jgi:orotidine 5'-phosphate decarboxylase subfamily 2